MFFLSFRCALRGSFCVLAFTFGTSGIAAQTVSQDGTDAHFSEEAWEKAVSGYEALLYIDKGNAANWFNLGASYQSLEAADKAKAAYEKALQHGYQPAIRAHYRLARVNMMSGQPEATLGHLETIAETGGLNFRVIENTTEFGALRDNPRFVAVIDALRPCQGEGYRDFDFWIGHWDVTSAGNTQSIANNKISNTQDGCVILEEYTAGFFTGTSLSFYDSVQGKWHQTWNSNSGGALYLEGGLDKDGAMVLSDADLPISKLNGSINRVTWTPLKDGTVRQHWQSSPDGEVWSDVFDGTYSLRTGEED